MKKILLGIVQIAVVLAVCGGVLLWSRGQESGARKQREEDIKKNTAESFVIVHYHLRKSERPRAPEGDYDFDEGGVESYILSKRTHDVVGVLIGKGGEVLVPEEDFWPDTVRRITVSGPGGKEVEAVADRILCKAPGRILRISGKLPEGWKPLEFSTGPETLDMDTELYGINLRRAEREFYFVEGSEEKEGYFVISKLDPVRKRGNTSKVPDYFRSGFGESVTVICEAGGQPVGVLVNGRIETAADGPIWRGAEVLADAGLKREEEEEGIKEVFGKYLYEITVRFRPPLKEEDDYDMGMFGSYWSGMGGGEGDQELTLYGLGVGPKRLLLPAAMEQGLVGGIDTITVQAGDEKLAAEFTGVLKNWEATVLTLKEGELPATVDIESPAELPRVEPFWTVVPRELAGMDLVVNYGRWLSEREGYEGKWYRQPERGVRDGCWLLDRQGRFAGMYTGLKRDYERLMPFLQGDGYGGYYPGFPMASMRRYLSSSRGRGGFWGETYIVDGAVLAEILAGLPEGLDPHVRHLSREEQKKRVWLGVEYTNVSKETAKQLDLREQTQDGRVGMMINRVYAKSPAARMGLVEGDVLLKLSVAEAPWPIELKPSRGDYESPDWGDYDVPEEFEAMGYRSPRKRPWPSRGNEFTNMLRAIGAGTKTQITYVHEGEIVTKEFVIEESLPDLLSAQKYKDEKLGLTVKDLTYEVRAALKLADEDQAIVVSKIEPGTPAALARMNAFELIRAVDGAEISTVQDFEGAITKAKEEGKESVRITVEWMGKRRLADLKFEAKSKNLQDMMKKLLPGGGE